MGSMTFATADDLGRAAASLAAAERDQLLAVANEAGGFDVTGPDQIIAALSSAPSKAQLKAYAADRRWRLETGGITVAGAEIQTDRASQAMITGAYAWSQANPSAPVSYKAAGGFVTLDAATMAAVATAVGAHVQACFATEAAVDAAIDAGTITTFAAVDAAGWPA